MWCIRFFKHSLRDMVHQHEGEQNISFQTLLHFKPLKRNFTLLSIFLYFFMPSFAPIWMPYFSSSLPLLTRTAASLWNKQCYLLLVTKQSGFFHYHRLHIFMYSCAAMLRNSKTMALFLNQLWYCNHAKKKVCVCVYLYISAVKR